MIEKVAAVKQDAKEISESINRIKAKLQRAKDIESFLGHTRRALELRPKIFAAGWVEVERNGNRPN